MTGDSEGQEHPLAKGGGEAQGSAWTRPELWFGLGFWVLVFAGIWKAFLAPTEADLHVHAPEPGRFVGSASYKGRPVECGLVHVVATDAKNRRHLASDTAALDKSGRFSLSLKLPAAADKKAPDGETPLSVTAELQGLADCQNQKQPLVGEATIFLNHFSPLKARTVALSGAAVLLLGLWLVVLFTGEIGKAKANLLFGTMYFMTFLALALPVGLTAWLVQNPYMTGKMEEGPIGLLRATTDSLPEEQWVLNIGGSVVKGGKGKATGKEELSPAQGEAAPAPAPKEEPPASAGAQRDGGGEPRAASGALHISGGVVVPFYVVLLAMFGAGINMTRRVPEIQETYGSVLPRRQPGFMTQTLRVITLGAVRPPGLPGPDPVPPPAGTRAPPGAEIPAPPPAPAVAPDRDGERQKDKPTVDALRRDLIANSMYLLSAPFLAIAVYYLLLVLAKDVSQPVLVVMAFATGLTADSIIAGIIGFAQKHLAQGGAASEDKIAAVVRNEVAKAMHLKPDAGHAEGGAGAQPGAAPPGAGETRK